MYAIYIIVRSINIILHVIVTGLTSESVNVHYSASWTSDNCILPEVEASRQTIIIEASLRSESTVVPGVTQSMKKMYASNL